MTGFTDIGFEHVFDVVVTFGSDRMIFGPLPGIKAIHRQPAARLRGHA
jgi:hypothetical protein